MQHLNYCRQMVSQYQQADTRKSMPRILERMQHCITVARLSEKFLLPERGYLLDDPSYRAIDESLPLNLPYRNIALEFEFPRVVDEGKAVSTKRIVFANDGDDKDYVLMRSVAYINHLDLWCPFMICGIPKTGFLDRTTYPQEIPRVALRPFEKSEDAAREIEDSLYEARVLLGLVNALACSNVTTAKSDPPNPKAKLKRALPFDSYHLLTIRHGKETAGDVDIGDHRSPREHLRRGHIRRYESGLKIWVNATVVNPGIGGKVDKDYRMAA